VDGRISFSCNEISINMILSIARFKKCAFLALLMLFSVVVALVNKCLVAEAKPLVSVFELSQTEWNNSRRVQDLFDDLKQREHLLLNLDGSRRDRQVSGGTINQQERQTSHGVNKERGLAWAPFFSQSQLANVNPAKKSGAIITNGTRVSIEWKRLHKALLGLQNPKLLGGDILMRTSGRRQRGGHFVKFQRSALVSAVSLWPDGVIFYELDGSVAHLANLIQEAMQQFHAETCIRFIRRENNEPDYLRIEALKGCFSYIGRIGGEQTLSLGDGCEFRGTITHELLHAVGFYHHQNRSDRDQFLEIIWENIARGKEGQFKKMAPHENVLLNEFDYDSIMLYGPRTFGKTLDRVTMKPKRDGVVLLEVMEKLGLSTLDIDSVNKLYKCKAYK